MCVGFKNPYLLHHIQNRENYIIMVVRKKSEKNPQLNKRKIIRTKIVKELTEWEKSYEFRKGVANQVIPRPPDTFYCLNPKYPKHILNSLYENLTDYEQGLYFEDDGTLRPTTELGHPRNRWAKRYSSMLRDEDKKRAVRHGNYLKTSQTSCPIKNDKFPIAALATKKQNRAPFGLTAILKALMQKPSKHSADKTVARMIIEVMLEKAQRGDFQFIREVYNRVEGKVPDQLQMQSPQQAASDAQTLLVEMFKNMGVN